MDGDVLTLSIRRPTFAQVCPHAPTSEEEESVSALRRIREEGVNTTHAGTVDKARYRISAQAYVIHDTPLPGSINYFRVVESPADSGGLRKGRPEVRNFGQSSPRLAAQPPGRTSTVAAGQRISPGVCPSTKLKSELDAAAPGGKACRPRCGHDSEVSRLR